MTAHGTDPNEVNEETFNDICLMFSDGLIGNYRIIETLGNLTAGVYNYMRSSNASSYKLQDIIPTVYDYLYPPLSEEEKKNSIEINNGRIFITDRKYRLPACVDQRTQVYEHPGTYTIYHLALENDDYYMNYGIYANGLLVESCSKRYLKELSGMELIE